MKLTWNIVFLRNLSTLTFLEEKKNEEEDIHKSIEATFFIHF